MNLAPGVELTTSVREDLSSSPCETKNFLPYPWWMYKDNLISRSEQRPINVSWLIYPMAYRLTLNQTGKSPMVGRKSNQTKVLFNGLREWEWTTLLSLPFFTNCCFKSLPGLSPFSEVRKRKKLGRFINVKKIVAVCDWSSFLCLVNENRCVLSASVSRKWTRQNLTWKMKQ